MKETLSPAMDILVSSNFERLLWFLAYNVYASHSASVSEKSKLAGETVKGWLNELKSSGGFGVEASILQAAKEDFESERVSDEDTLATIKSVYSSYRNTPAANSDASTGTTGHMANGRYILDPHSAIGVAASLRSIKRTGVEGMHHVSLATAHPAKFSKAVEMALRDEEGFTFETVLPKEFVGLEKKEKRVRDVRRDEGLDGLRKLIKEEVEMEKGEDRVVNGR